MKTQPTTMNRVCRALRMKPDRYIEIMYESGNQYLEYYEANTLARVPEHKHRSVKRFTNAFRFSVKFWYWWRFETEAVDRAFLAGSNQTLATYLHMSYNRLSVPPQAVIDEILTSNPNKVTA